MVAIRAYKGTNMNARTMLVLAGLLCSTQAGAHGGQVDLSVYDRTEGKRLPVLWHAGRAYVVGKPGNEYQVTVRNRLQEEMLAVVSVDGVNVISGETANPSQTGYVLSAMQSYSILGWRKSLAETAAFYFTALPDSYAARTGRPDNVGVIGIAVFRKKQPPQPIASPAPAEQPERRAMARSRGDAAAESARIGTGHGRRENSYVQNVEFERATQSPAETVVLYYDSYANLVARGVIRETVPVAPLPRPFPGFVPDPRG
jgi:hypothetical protein